MDRKELRELRRFLQASFFNPRPEVIPLLDFLQGELKLGRFPERIEIAKALFPNETVSDLQIRRLMSYLTKGIEKYLTWKEVMADKTSMDLHLLRAYRHRRLSKGFQSVASRIEKSLASQAVGDENFHFNQYLLHLEQYNFTANRSGKTPPDLNRILQELDHFYIANKLKQACNALSHQRLFKYEYEVALLDALLDHIRTTDLLQVPVIAVYYHSYMTLTSEDEKHFYALRGKIMEHIDLFDEENQRSIFMLAINYCIRQLNQGQNEYLREVFELYRQALEAGILLENAQLSHLTYKNIVSAALKLGEFSWTERFLSDYCSALPPAFRESSFAYNKAQFFFAKGAFQNALRLLLPVSSEDLFTQLDTRVLMIKCCFELGDSDAVEYQLDNFRQLLRRKKLMTYHHQHYSSFVDFSRALVLGKNGAALRAEIAEAETLAEKDWLLKQLGRDPFA